MTATASRWMTVSNSEQNINAGFTVHVLDYKDMKTLVAVIAEFQSLSWTQQLNDPGTGSITFDEDDPMWGVQLNPRQSRLGLLQREYVFEIWDRDVRVFAFIADTVSQSGSDETRSVTISGPGLAGVLKWAIINRPGWPAKVPILSYTPSQADPKVKIPNYRANSDNDKLPAFLWRFPVKWPTMRMWYTVFKAAQRRGLIKFVSLNFTATLDSAKKPWLDVQTIEELATKTGYQPDTPSENLLDFLNDCTGQDYSKWFGQRLEWQMYPGFQLVVREHIGRDCSETVRFFQGNILSVERTRSRESIVNRVIAVDVEGNETNMTNQRSVSTWNLRESRNETNKNVTDPKLRGALAWRYLQQGDFEKDEWSIKIPYDSPGRIPYRNFFIGDEIGFNIEFNGWSPNATAAPSVYRVMAITISIAQEQTVPDVELTLQSVIDSKMIELEKQITDLINNPRVIAIDDLKDISIPEQPVSKKALVYNPDTKKWEAGDYSSGGGGAGGKVYMQKTDPAAATGHTVTAGDFWLETYD